MWNVLSEKEKRIILEKGTEQPFTGAYTNTTARGTYVCKQCNTPIFTSDMKFHSGCGWPSFDKAIPNAIKEIQDSDGMRTEITCASCNGHLGHVFRGEHETPENTRHCVNSLSLHFIPD